MHLLDIDLSEKRFFPKNKTMPMLSRKLGAVIELPPLLSSISARRAAVRLIRRWVLARVRPGSKVLCLMFQFPRERWARREQT